jgi:hypothetical protein
VLRYDKYRVAIFIAEEVARMPLEILVSALSLIDLAAVAAMVLVAAVALLDPTVVARCHDCRRWMIDAGHRSHTRCFRCRHHHAQHARLPA